MCTIQQEAAFNDVLNHSGDEFIYMRQNIYQYFDSQETSHISPSKMSHEVYFVSVEINWPCYTDTAQPHSMCVGRDTRVEQEPKKGFELAMWH